MKSQRAFKIIPPPPNNQIGNSDAQAKVNTSLPQLAHNRYIIVFKDQGDREISEVKAQEATQRTQSLLSDFSIQQDSVIHQYKYALKGFAAKLTPLQAEQLQKDSRVEQVVQDIKYKAIQMVPSTNSKVETMLMAQTTPWGITRVGGVQNGIGKKAWVLDTGIDLNHSDLNVDVSSSVSFVAGESADDGNGHGTHVSGTIAAKNNSSGVVGVAAGAQVVAVKVCNSAGQCYTSDLDAGVDYVASQYSAGDVANISLGWPISGNSRVDLPLYILEATIEAAADDGLKFAIAAGNEDQHANNKSPARVNNSNVWTVSAYDDQDVFASFSNYGNPHIEYSGPGVDVLSLWKNGSTNTINGTSMAAPHIAGLLLIQPSAIKIDGYVSGDPDSSPDAIAVFDALEVTISGPTYRESGEQGTWTANASGSTSYSYQWYYRNTATSSWNSAGSNSSTFSHTFFNSTTAAQNAGVRVVVTSGSETAEDIHTVAIAAECADPSQIFCL